MCRLGASERGSVRRRGGLLAGGTRVTVAAAAACPPPQPASHPDNASLAAPSPACTRGAKWAGWARHSAAARGGEAACRQAAPGRRRRRRRRRRAHRRNPPLTRTTRRWPLRHLLARSAQIGQVGRVTARQRAAARRPAGRRHRGGGGGGGGGGGPTAATRLSPGQRVAGAPRARCSGAGARDARRGGGHCPARAPGGRPPRPRRPGTQDPDMRSQSTTEARPETSRPMFLGPQCPSFAALPRSRHTLRPIHRPGSPSKTPPWRRARARWWWPS